MNLVERAHSSNFNPELKLKGFKAYEIDSKADGDSYNRNDFYKIGLNTGSFVFHYTDQSFETQETILFFGNPRIPYSCEVFSQADGYACLFTEDFLKISEQSKSLLQSLLFKIGVPPILQLNQEQKTSIVSVYQHMLVEQEADYTFKDELIRDYINLLIHEALKCCLP